MRRAFNHAFDFEWANKNLFYDQYRRVDSYFQNTELASSGLPEGRELEILTEVKEQIPPEVFTHTLRQPQDGRLRPDARQICGKATKLFNEAGWVVKDRKLVNKKTGEQMTADFLLVSPLFERIVQPYMRNLERLGVKTSRCAWSMCRSTAGASIPSTSISSSASFRPIAVARERTARFLGLGRCGQGRQPQSDRHQGPGNRQADRQDHLRR